MTISDFATLLSTDSGKPVSSSSSQTISISGAGEGVAGTMPGAGSLPASRPFLNHIKDAGYEENSNRAGSEHSADDRCSHDLASDRTSAARRPQRNAAEDERERRHQDWAQPQFRSFKSRSRERFSVFVLILGELDDQDRRSSLPDRSA